MQEVETGSIDLRYEGHRLRSPARERRLLASILERGIQEPLAGVEVEGSHVLLDGFKRFRCARRLKMGHVSFSAIAQDEATGLIVLLRTSNRSGLELLEQAGFVDELCRVHGMSLAEVAERLGRSKTWVHARLGLVSEMPPAVRARILAGSFPGYAYMATLRPFMRMNGVSRHDVVRFVHAVSGHGLSVRKIDDLAQAFFAGPSSLREAVEGGRWPLVLERLAEVRPPPQDCKPSERQLLKDLELLVRVLVRVARRSGEARRGSPAFRAQAHLLLTQLHIQLTVARRALKELHDRTAETPGDLPPAPGRNGDSPDRSPSSAEPQGRAPDHPRAGPGRGQDA